MAYVEHGGSLPGASLQVDGDLTLRQTWPLSVYGGELKFWVGVLISELESSHSTGCIFFSSSSNFVDLSV